MCTRCESLLQKQNDGTFKLNKADFDIAVVSQVTLAFHINMHKGQISAKCQKLEMR